MSCRYLVGVFDIVGTHFHKLQEKFFFGSENFYLCPMTDNDFEDFINELDSDERNENANCSLDNPDCESCSG